MAGTDGIERTDAKAGPVGLVFAAIVLGCSLVLIPSWLVLRGLQAREAAAQAPPSTTTAAGAPDLPPEPRLQTTIAGDLERLREREDAVLNSYGWTAPEEGIARLPIERAIALVAERGLPAREGAGEWPKPWPATRGRDGTGGSNTRALGSAKVAAEEPVP